MRQRHDAVHHPREARIVRRLKQMDQLVNQHLLQQSLGFLARSMTTYGRETDNEKLVFFSEGRAGSFLSSGLGGFAPWNFAHFESRGSMFWPFKLDQATKHPHSGKLPPRPQDGPGQP